VRPQYPRGDWRKGAQATVALMAAGADCIVGGVLIDAVEQGVYLVSCPDILVKQGGWSVWGDWQYAPVDIKLGKKAQARLSNSQRPSMPMCWPTLKAIGLTKVGSLCEKAAITPLI
jgi:predicted RecB family nuclease